jgi:hypothetical protein
MGLSGSLIDIPTRSLMLLAQASGHRRLENPEPQCGCPKGDAGTGATGRHHAPVVVTDLGVATRRTTVSC